MMLDFFKMHGTGNDFILIDNFKGSRHKWVPDFVQELCRAHTGIGADGLLIIEPAEDADFKMRFFNSDGHESDMCVNGSRCICYLANHLKIVGKKFRFMARDGIHRAEILPGDRVRVEVLYHPLKDDRTFPVDFKLPDSLYFRKFLNTGVPHVILETADARNAPVESIGKALRFHGYYAPEGTNVNFVQIINSTGPYRIRIRTYERGVDSETLSCGSGATAAALSFFAGKDNGRRQVGVLTNGGELTVCFSGEGEKISLQGPVKIVYKGTYLKEDI